MAALEGIGDILGGVGDIKPETLALLHDRERLAVEDAYKRSMLGVSSARVAAEMARAGRPISTPIGLFNPGEREPFVRFPSKPVVRITKEGQVVTVDPNDPNSANVTTPPGLLSPSPKNIPYMAPGGMREKGLAAAPGIMARTDVDGMGKLQLLMSAGLTGADAKTYMDHHTQITSMANQAQQAYARRAAGKSLPGDDALIKGFEDFTFAGSRERKEGGATGAFNTKELAASTAAAVAAAMEKIRTGEGFDDWDVKDKEQAFLDKYYSGRDPRFAWGDRKSYNQFQKGYYHWMSTTNRSPLMAISDRADIGSLKTSLNNITKMETLIQTYTDRIDANAKVVEELQRKYGKNQFSRMVNQAQNMWQSGIVGSGDLESLKLALFSLSQEVTKVEKGQLGISGVSVTEAQEIGRIHSVDLSAEELQKVINTSVWLGKTSKEAMRKTRDSILERMSQIGPSAVPPPPIPPPSAEVIKKLVSSKQWANIPEGDTINIDGKPVGIKRGNTVVPIGTPIITPPAMHRINQ